MFDVDFKASKVKDVEEARSIIDSYEKWGFRLIVDDQGNLGLSGRDWEFAEDCWPYAIPWDEVPDQRDYPGNDEGYEAWIQAVCEKGEEGFLVMLRELSPLLEEPFMILATMTTGGTRQTQVWVVQPGAEKVETLQAGSSWPLVTAK